jgi:ankyrin repeat protein
VKYLVNDVKVDVNVVDLSGFTAKAFASNQAIKTFLEQAEKAQQPKTTPGTKCPENTNVALTDTERETILNAARDNDMKKVKLLVNDTNQKCLSYATATNSSGYSLLHTAAYVGNLELVKYLVDKGANANGVDNYKRSVLHHAAISGNLDLVKYLVEDHKADLTGVNIYNESVLHYAAGSGKLELVEYLVEDKDANALGVNSENISVLHRAATTGNLELVKYLVEKHKANANGVDNYKFSVLHHAAGSGSLEIVEYLVRDMKADVNAVTKTGSTVKAMTSNQAIKTFLEKAQQPKPTTTTPTTTTTTAT